jgi:opacity protein-like surface antigen
MKRSVVGGILIVTLAAFGAAEASAQETGTPIFKAPYRAFEQHEFGASLSDPGSGVRYALEGFYRYGYKQFDVSVRGGWAKLSGPGGGTRYLLGGDLRTRVLDASEKIPVDGALTLGFGGNVGTGTDAYYLPVGISLGRRFNLEGSQTTFVPYAHPVIIPTFGGGDSRVDFALGLGVDIRFARNWAVRVSGGIGDIDGVGVSLAYVR